MVYIKKVVNADPGDADHVGGDNWDKLDDLFDNVDNGLTAKINSSLYFRSSKLSLRNPADTFQYNFVAAAIAANRDLNFPLLTATDTLVAEAFIQTLTNKTINATNNTINDSSIATGDLLKSNGTKFLRFGIGSALQVLRVNAGGTDLEYASPAGGGDMVLASVQTVSGAKTFLDQTLKLRNPANTFSYTLVHGAISADRNLNLPVITATDTLAALGVANDHGDFDNSFKDNRLRIWNPADTFRTTIINSAIAANRNLNIPLITADDTIDVLGLAQTFTAAKTFNNSLLKLRNPADTFSYTIVPAAIAADRNLNLPLITGTDTLAALGMTQSFTGANTFTGGVDLNSALAISNDETITLTGTQNNLAVAANTNYIRFNNASSLTITGILISGGNADGDILIIHNVTAAQTVALNDEDAGSTATNRFALNATITLAFDQSALLQYDGTTQRWRVVSTSIVGGAGGGDMVLASVQTVTGAKTFLDQTLKLRNPANTFSYTLVHGAIAADRNLNVPVITATDTLATLGLAQTFTGDITFAAGRISQGFNRYEGDISPSQITADQSDYNPTNLATSTVLRLDADSSFRSIGGLQGGADGRIIELLNISANTILLSDENTTHGQASSAANRFKFAGNDLPLFPDQGVSLRYDSTSSRWRLVAGQQPIIPNIRYGWNYKSDMFRDDTVIYSFTAASGGTQGAASGSVRHPGLREYTLGTSATGFGSMFPSTSSCMILGNNQYWRFDMLLKILVLSSASPRYTLRVGFIDADNAESVDCACFRYTDNVNSGKWQRVTRDNSTETATDTGITAQNTNFSLFTVIVNPAGTNAQFFIDNVSVGANTTNIPTGGARHTAHGMMFLKSAGTTNTAFLQMDAYELTNYSNIVRTT